MVIKKQIMKVLKEGESDNILELSRAINYLGLCLYQELAKEKRNLFFSPLSLSSALTMLFCGARENTLEEMRQALGFEFANIPDENIKHCFKHLFSTLENLPDSITLNAANIMFIQKDSVKEEFKILLSESFKAMTFEVDFRTESAQAIQQANDWVKAKTNGMITKLLDSLDPETMMVVLNAVYFRGFWVHQFNEKATSLRNFFNKGLESNAKKVQMMYQKGSFPFVDKGTYKALQLHYRGDEIAMLILLPKERNGLEELELKLTSNFISELKSHMRKQEVILTLPKFRLEYSKSMAGDFQNLGMKAAFQPGANFDTMSDSRDILVSEIIHKAVIEVDEEGTRAAATTGIILRPCCAKFIPSFVVDCPFLFLIHNVKTNLILFIGRIDEL